MSCEFFCARLKTLAAKIVKSRIQQAQVTSPSGIASNACFEIAYYGMQRA